MIRMLLAAALVALTACSSSPTRRAAEKRPSAPVLPAPNMAPRQVVPRVAPEQLLVLAQKAFQAKDFSRAFDYYITAATSF